MLPSTFPEKISSTWRSFSSSLTILRPAFFEFVRHPRRVALDREVQVADGHAGNQVAHGPARQIEVRTGLGGQFLHAHHRRALFGG